MCNQCFSYVQFPGILDTDTNPTWNNCSYTGTVDGLVDDNPQFFWYFGDSGVNTLCTHMEVDDVDLELGVTRGQTQIVIKGKPIIVHPPHAPH